MLEVGGIPTLCRNGDSPIQRVKPLEQEQKFSDLRPSLDKEQRVFLFMAVAAAEQNTYFGETLQAPAIAVPETVHDFEARQRAAQFIGRVALNEGSPTDEAVLNFQPIESLHQAIHEAAKGNAEARAMVEINTRTDVIERTMKSGHVMKVDLMVDEAGNIQQHGQNMESVQANSLRFAADSWQMRERVEAETTNLFRIQQLHEQGVLDEYCFVVISRAADNMTEQDMTKAGFFTDTMSCAIQVTTAENNRLTMESAFVAGVKKSGGQRHDQETTRGVVAELGVDHEDMGATERLNTPFLVHKSKLKNGAVDLVKLWDKCTPKDHDDEEIFFGESKPQQDYLEYLETCRQREERFEPKVQKIAKQLISRRASINNPVAAVRCLNKISGKEMIEQALGDMDIDPRVFGPVSAAEIVQARAAFEQGRYERAVSHVNAAKANDRSSSCPGAARNLGHETENNSTESDECEFISKQCPECGTKNVKTKVTKTHISGSCGCRKKK